MAEVKDVVSKPEHDWWQEYLDKQARRAKDALISIRIGLIQLKERYLLGGFKIQIEYSGAGDSGEMYDTTFHKGQMQGVGISRILATRQDFEDKDKIRIKEIIEGIEEDCYDILTYDWYNNEGGQGTIEFDINELKVYVHGSYNVQSEHDCSEAGQETFFDLSESI